MARRPGTGGFVDAEIRLPHKLQLSHLQQANGHDLGIEGIAGADSKGLLDLATGPRVASGDAGPALQVVKDGGQWQPLHLIGRQRGADKAGHGAVGGR